MSPSFVHSMILAHTSKTTLKYSFDCRSNSMQPMYGEGRKETTKCWLLSDWINYEGFLSRGKYYMVLEPHSSSTITQIEEKHSQNQSE